MNLPSPSPSYDPQNEAAARAEIKREDERNIKTATDITFSGDSTDGGPKLILKAPDGGLWRLVISNVGVLTEVAL
jgi:hypothetical protein